MRFWAALAFGRILGWAKARCFWGLAPRRSRRLLMSLLWLHFVEKQAFTKWGLIGGAICLLGACAVLYGGRG